MSEGRGGGNGGGKGGRQPRDTRHTSAQYSLKYQDEFLAQEKRA